MQHHHGPIVRSGRIAEAAHDTAVAIGGLSHSLVREHFAVRIGLADRFGIIWPAGPECGIAVLVEESAQRSQLLARSQRP
jgi:hypothetical protein